jgi:two-component sensor histidine kinase
MDSLLKYLPSTNTPLAVRYGVTVVLVAVFFLFSVAAEITGGRYPFLLTIPIILASILFDRGSGFIATALGIVTAAPLMDWRTNVIGHLTVLTFFAIIGLFLAAFCEALRRALERGAEARQELELMMTEQRHRVKNDLALVSSMISLQARSESSPLIRAALESAIGRLHVVTDRQDHFQLAAGDQTNMQEYLEAVCWRLGEALRDVRPIAVRVDAGSVALDGRRAVRIEVVVNELVTNALKHAFPGDRSGTIYVTLRRRLTDLTIVVEDDGGGCAEGAQAGLGSRLVMLLTQQSGGSVKRESANPGCRVVIAIPQWGAGAS